MYVVKWRVIWSDERSANIRSQSDIMSDCKKVDLQVFGKLIFRLEFLTKFNTKTINKNNEAKDRRTDMEYLLA